jgi:hypothetical protein
MILGIEIAMLVIGLLALVRGRMTISKSKVVTGAAARLLGLVALTPLPVALAAVGLYVAAAGGAADPERFVEDKRVTITLIEAGVVIGIAILVFGIGAAIGRPPEPARSDDDEDEEDDRPRKRRDRDDEIDDEYDDRPRKRRRHDEDDE